MSPLIYRLMQEIERQDGKHGPFEGTTLGRARAEEAAGMTMPSRQSSSATCPRAELHTAAPVGYLAWHAWAEAMAKTHRQKRCPGCGLLKIWVAK